MAFTLRNFTKPTPPKAFFISFSHVNSHPQSLPAVCCDGLGNAVEALWVWLYEGVYEPARWWSLYLVQAIHTTQRAEPGTQPQSAHYLIWQVQFQTDFKISGRFLFAKLGIFKWHTFQFGQTWSDSERDKKSNKSEWESWEFLFWAQSQVSHNSLEPKETENVPSNVSQN